MFGSGYPSTDRRLLAAIGLGAAAAVVLLVVLLASGVFGGGDEDPAEVSTQNTLPPATPPVPETTPTTPTALGSGVASTRSAIAAASDPRGIQARPADAFVDSIGVAVHLTYGDTKYGDKVLVKRALADSGIRHIRDGWGCGSADAVDFLKRELVPLGIRVTMVHDPNDGASPAALHACHKAQGVTRYMAGAEGPNEKDGAAQWDLMREWAKGIATAYRGDPATRRIPTICPSFADTNTTGKYEALGDLSASCDYGNTHNYPGDQMQMNDSILRTVKNNWSHVTRNRPVIATETGYSLGTCNALQPIANAEAEAYHLPRLFLEHYKAGLPRTFTYELLDQHPDCNFESNFGLVRNDGTYKPAFTAVRSLIRLLSDKGTAIRPGQLDFALTGGDDATRSLLLQKRDGSFWLAVWQQEKAWDGTQVVGTGRPVTLTLQGRPATTLRTYLPSTKGTTAVTTASAVAESRLTSSTQLTLVEIVR